MLDAEHGEAVLAELESRLIDSEARVREYDAVLSDREQELTLTQRELRSATDTVRALQGQLEQAYLAGATAGAAANGTTGTGASPQNNAALAAILETKDSRISTLERELTLLERELSRIREIPEPLLSSTATTAAMLEQRTLTEPFAHFASSLGLTDPAKLDPRVKRHLDEFRTEISRRDQELLAVSAKMKTLEEQHQDYQRHIAVLKESLCAKEEHYNMLQADCEELRQRLEEKNRLIEKKTQAALQATQERNRIGTEVNELRDHMDIKDRKINVLQRKMELYDANQKLSSGAAQGEAEAVAQRKQLEEQRRRLEEHRRQLDTKVKQLDEKEKALAEVDQKLKKRKDKMDQLEAQMQKQQQQQQQQMQSQQNNQQGMQQMQQQLQQVQQERQQLQQQLQQQQQAQQQGNQERQKMQGERQQLQQQVQQLQQEKQKMQQQMQQAGAKGGANPEIEKELAKTRDDAKRAQDEMERLLKLVQMSQEEQNQKEKTIMELQNALKNAQAKLKTAQQAAHQAEEESTDFVQIEELQEALRESVRLTVAEEQRRNELTEKVGRLERRLRSLQSARALRCPTCRPLLCRVPALQQRLDRLLAERRSHLEDLVRMKQEALEAALSEKDAHLALLEMSGVRTARQADQLERLRADRARLTQRLQAETEQAARMLATYALTPENEVETGPPSHVLLDVLLGEIGDDHEEEDFEEDRNADFADNVEPDSLDESSSPRTSVARTSK